MGLGSFPWKKFGKCLWFLVYLLISPTSTRSLGANRECQAAGGTVLDASEGFLEQMWGLLWKGMGFSQVRQKLEVGVVFTRKPLPSTIPTS